jgi:hypothetical protein
LAVVGLEKKEEVVVGKDGDLAVKARPELAEGEKNLLWRNEGREIAETAVLGNDVIRRLYTAWTGLRGQIKK